MDTIPTLEETDQVLWDFVTQDLRAALNAITQEMRTVRSKPHWQAADLISLKINRAQLQLALSKALVGGMSEDEHQAIQHLLNNLANDQPLPSSGD